MYLGAHSAFVGCREEYEEVVRVLLEREEVAPTSQIIMGERRSRIPWYGGEGVAKILLGREEVNPGKPGNNSKRPLWWVSWSGHRSIV